ncbi:MAG: putative lipid II flippase FtsW [Deltaproteobacteria bacterium]|nr:putative lipid II flippase FtsW [Deltaproteobacteria bacterium]
MKARRFDLPLMGLVVVLLILGLVMVQSASGPVAADRLDDPWYYVKRQLAAIIVGIIGGVGIAFTPYEWLRRYAWAAYAAIIIGLILVFVPGLSHRVNGASRWIGMGSVNLQPSELAKLVCVLCMAHFIDEKGGRLDDVKNVLLPALAIPVPLMLLIVMEPDFGTTVIIGGMAFLTLVVAGLRTRFIYALFGLGVTVGALVAVAEPYRLKRLRSFMDPWADAAGSGYQVIQSMIAFHSGGLTGRGLGESQAKHLFLPEPWTDFIGSVLGEELGLIGVLALLTLYGLLIWRGMHVARQAEDLFGALLATSLTAAIGLQAFFNLGVVMGIVPPKGLVLPFMSYGASAIVAQLFAVGLLLNVSANSAAGARAPTIYRPSATAEGVLAR